MKCFITIFSAVFFSFCFLAQAEDNLLILGKYKSLNKKIEHNFSDKGDYTGVVHFEKVIKNYRGVYRHSKDICWLPDPKGSKGVTGNVVIYYDEQQCCLLFEKISDKVAVTFVWAKPYSHVGSYGICTSQVLEKSE